MSKKTNKPIFLFVAKDKEPLFSKKNRALLTDPLDDNNPITVQVLGICSALAITVQLEPAIVMTISVIAVMGASNVIVSLLEINALNDKYGNDRAKKHEELSLTPTQTPSLFARISRPRL